MSVIDWSGIYKKYKGLWVALAQDEKTVLASAKTARAAFEKAKRDGYSKPILTKMSPKLITYVGSGL